MAELTTLSAVTDCYPDQSLEGAGPELVIGASASFRWRTRNVKKAQLTDEVTGLVAGKTPEK